MKNKLSITVTAEDWREGECLHAGKCALALAAQRAVGPGHSVSVDGRYLAVYKSGGLGEQDYRLTAEARAMVRAFDHGQEAGVLPVTFELEPL